MQRDIRLLFAIHILNNAMNFYFYYLFSLKNLRWLSGKNLGLEANFIQFALYSTLVASTPKPYLIARNTLMDEASSKYKVGQVISPIENFAKII